MPDLADDVLAEPAEPADLDVAEAVPLGLGQELRAQRPGVPDPLRDLVEEEQLVEEPGVDPGGLVELFERGTAVSQDFAVPANSRFNVPIVTSEAPASATFMRVPRGTRFSAVVESLGGTPMQIVVERAMYWNANGQFWAAGSDLLATRLR